MTLTKVIEAADSLYPNTFSSRMKTQWVGECEAAVQTDAYLLPPEAVVMPVWDAQPEAGAVSFPAGDTMCSQKPLPVQPGGSITLSGLEDYAENNGVTAVVKNVSADRRTVVFTENVFPSVGTRPDSGDAVISYDGSQAELFAPEAYAQLYREYLCARICAHQGNSTGYENNMTMYNASAGRLIRYTAGMAKRKDSVPAAVFHAARSAGAN